MPAPRVMPEAIKALVNRLTFQVGRDGDTTSTFAHAYLDGFYIASGHSACVSPANYNEEIGNKIALGNCLPLAEAKLWELEGYALRQELDNGYNLLTPAQQALPDHEVRVFIEHNQLYAKATKLQAFLETQAAMDLPAAEQDLLLEQLDHMTKYGAVLNDLIKLFGVRAAEAAAVAELADKPTIQ